MSRKRALVTGASRGIGKAISLALAAAGYDVVISARTVKSGTNYDNSLTVHKTDMRPLPGSLEETAGEIQKLGGRALTVAADLTDRVSVGACAQRVLDEWGGVDLVVHNGRYIGPGIMDVFLDTPLDAYPKFFEAHCMAPIILTRALLPGMLERGQGDFVNITSSSAYNTPPAPAGKGGWGLGYAVGKASGHPLMGTLHAEFSGKGIRAFNVQPGFVGTERNEIIIADIGRELKNAAPPAAIGAVVVWLLQSGESAQYSGTSVEAQDICLERKLYPSWK
ncbi:NAD(P)-dependent oxidoreductase [Sphingobium sp. SCG-1]|uniref:SDR family NAD(P)-dependent oxidoreductase n=1 Tax=Sphingobium sp. SCG-1 TaxID=2072936 RepID=UPI000CD68A71|nr:SDR family oxidoreductase [Sphingobium sp. SCG-1]AUW57149.1 NAD(P)-dependent oxidoreductase [Sphingobium sp. SCG-1]